MTEHNPTVSLRSARESVRGLIRAGGAYLDSEGLKIPRDPRRSPSQLDVDEVLERLEVLGVPDAEVSVAIKRGKDRSAYLEVQVTNAGVDLLAPLYPQLQAGREALAAGPAVTD